MALLPLHRKQLPDSPMDKTEAQGVLDQQLASFTRRSYTDLLSTIDHPQTTQAKGSSGTIYNIEFNVFYDDSHRKQDLRIMGSIDDGRGRSFVLPLTRSEIMKPTGELV
jgi:hypothetical protein